jgi:DNA-binding IclR family transcriptional regulator
VVFPPAEIPTFAGKAPAPEAMSDAEWLDLLARHPIALAALAAAAGVDLAAVETRLAPLVAAGKLAIEEHHGVQMARATFA